MDLIWNYLCCFDFWGVVWGVFTFTPIVLYTSDVLYVFYMHEIALNCLSTYCLFGCIQKSERIPIPNYFQSLRCSSPVELQLTYPIYKFLFLGKYLSMNPNFGGLFLLFLFCVFFPGNAMYDVSLTKQRIFISVSFFQLTHACLLDTKSLVLRNVKTYKLEVIEVNEFISMGFISAPYLNYNGFLVWHSTLSFERRSY